MLDPSPTQSPMTERLAKINRAALLTLQNHKREGFALCLGREGRWGSGRLAARERMLH